MATIERVRMEDVYPYEDEYGNLFLSRDYDAPENKKYVERLAESMRAKGVPDEMVQLCRDGGIYRIVSGNSRIKAMQILGTKVFEAIILDDVEAEQAMRRAVDVTVRTNTKKTYSSLEESRFVQQLALFRPDEYVAEAAGIPTERVRSLRRGKKVVGEDCYEMTIERLCAIAEFEDDKKAVKILSQCKESDIGLKLSSLRHERERLAWAKDLVDAFKERGVPLVSNTDDYKLIGILASVEDIPEEIPEGAVIKLYNASGRFIHYGLYAPEDESTTEEESNKQAIRAIYEANYKTFMRGRAKRAAWLKEAIEEGGNPLDHLRAMVLANKYRFKHTVASYIEEAQIDPNRIGVGIAEIIREVANRDSGSGIYYSNLTVSAWSAQQYVELLDALKGDGYEPDEDELALYEVAQDAITNEEEE